MLAKDELDKELILLLLKSLKCSMHKQIMFYHVSTFYGICTIKYITKSLIKLNFISNLKQMMLKLKYIITSNRLFFILM